MLTLLLACTSGPDSAIPAEALCETETRAGPLNVQDRFVGDQGFEVEVTSLDPDPVIVGYNQWVISLEGHQDCNVGVATEMPDHGHGAGLGASWVEEDELHLQDLYLSLGGYWEIHLAIACPDASDGLTIPLCLEP